jgi:hypothetical protein
MTIPNENTGCSAVTSSIEMALKIAYRTMGYAISTHGVD